MAGKKADAGAGKDDEPVVIETKPGHHKDIGGGDSDKWNFRQMRLVMSALPGVNSADKKTAGEVGSAVISGVMDVKPTDPIEGMLTSQMVVAHEAALEMYRRAWSQPPDFFDARCRYLQMADKAQRTLAILTERLDRHRGAGQQHITVKHVTVNADNAIVGDVNQAPGVAPSAEIKGQPHALGHAIQPALWSENPQRQPLSVAGDAERTVPDARGPITGRPERE
jgi:hypothetical protein